MKISLQRKVVQRLNLTSHPKHKERTARKIFRKPKSFLLRLQEKQRLRYHHAITHQQLERYVSQARSYPGPKGLSLLCELAMRLDSVVFDAQLACSIRSARQLIRHKHVFVNGKIVSSPGYRCRPQDLIQVSPTSKVRKLVNFYLLKNRLSQQSRSRPIRQKTNTFYTPNYIEVCVREQKIFVTRNIKPRELGFKVNHMLVMEYFS